MSVIGTFGGTAPTLTPGDTITALGGTNNLSLTVTGADAVTNPFAPTTISGIQTFNIRDVSTNAAAAIFDFAAISGETRVNSNLSTHAVSFTGLAAGTTIGMVGNSAVTNGNISATYVASATSTNIAVTGDVVGAPTIAVTNATGITSASITSSGATSTAGAVLGGITLAGGNTVTSATVNAGSDLTTGNITAFSTTATTTLTITGAGRANVGTLQAELDVVNAAGSTGGITATLNSATATVTGGSGNDRINTASIQLSTGSVNAGDGAADRLIVGNTNSTNTNTLGARYSNFEVLEVANGVTVDVDNLSATNTFTAARYTDGGVINNMNTTMAANVTVTTGGNSATFGIKDATNPGTVNTLNITADDGVANNARQTIALGTPVATGVEAVNLTATDNITIAALTSMASLETLGLSGGGTITITSGALAINANTVINGASATGVTTLNLAAATGRGVAITTGSGADIIAATAIAGLADVIVAGGGADRIIGDSNVETQTIVYSAATGGTASVITVTIAGVTVSTAAAVANNATAAAAATAVNTAINASTALQALGISSTVDTATVTISSTAINGNIAQATTDIGLLTMVAPVVTTTAQGALNVAGDIMTGGAGNDRFFISAGAGNTVANADTITDLNLGGSTSADNADVLSLMGAGLNTQNAIVATLTSAQQASVTAAASLAAAVDIVLAANQVARTATQFTYGSDTYLAVNVDGGADYTAAADYLIKITGVTGTLSATDIVFVG